MIFQKIQTFHTRLPAATIAATFQNYYHISIKEGSDTISQNFDQELS
jgi:hypothetical protein